jgi:DMSO/TMAO reductase YedYZ heme-binding membrane subunit
MKKLGQLLSYQRELSVTADMLSQQHSATYGASIRVSNNAQIIAISKKPYVISDINKLNEQVKAVPCLSTHLGK